MEKETYLALCAAMPGAKTDQPFAHKGNPAVVARHGASRKWFALVMEAGGRTLINLKCEPLRADFWRSAYRAVTPAYHMNKTHWNSIDLCGDVPDDILEAMTWESYELTRSKKVHKKEEK